MSIPWIIYPVYKLDRGLDLLRAIKPVEYSLQYSVKRFLGNTQSQVEDFWYTNCFSKVFSYKKIGKQ